MLAGFASLHGARFYGQPLSDDRITLVRSDTPVPYPGKIDTGAGPVTVFDPGFPLHWKIEGLA